MHRALGLSRDPFAPVCDGGLYWENAPRAAARRAALDAARSGRGVWIHGGPGCGRQAFAERVAGDLARGGRAVLVADGPSAPGADGFLRALLAGAGDPGPESGDPLVLAEALYARLVERFCGAGPVVVLGPWGGLAREAAAEAEDLAGLRVAGRPLALLILAGEGPAPFAGFQDVPLPAPAAGELRAVLEHRAAACGRPDLLPPDRLDRIAGEAGGIGDAVDRARREARRLLFAVRDGEPPAAAAEPGRPPLLDPEEIAEVDRLLDDLEPEPPAT